jgi:DNA-binding beta-propeller fold protein YncE
MAPMCHDQNSQTKPQRLGVILSVSVTALLVVLAALLILGLSPSVSASPLTSTYTVFLPLMFKYYRIPTSCTPQVWYTFPSFGSTPMGMAYDNTRTRLFVANHDSNSLAIIHAATSRNIWFVTNLPEASGVAFDAARNLIYVVGQNWLNVVDGATYAVVKTVFLGLSPDHNIEAHAVAYNPVLTRITV